VSKPFKQLFKSYRICGYLKFVRKVSYLVTTNGHIARAGRCVMGCGCAREARDRFPGLDRKLARLLAEHGNRPMRLMRLPDGSDLASFPVKHHWKERADPDLIEASARLLVEIADRFQYERVFLPRPGCGNGRLPWPSVRERIEPLLDDRFVILSFQVAAIRSQKGSTP